LNPLAILKTRKLLKTINAKSAKIDQTAECGCAAEEAGIVSGTEKIFQENYAG